MVVHSTQVYILLKPLFSRHKGIGVQFTDEPTGALDSRSSRLLLETMSDINRKMQATILMVTHDPFSASFCERILFLKDGKIFNEIFKGEKSRKDFFNEILDILTCLLYTSDAADEL